MKGLKYVMAITQREYSEQYVEFFRRHGAENVLTKLAHGTATASVLDYFDLEKTEKVVVSAVVTNKELDSVKKGLVQELNLNAVGNGVAVVMPIDCIGGNTAKEYFVGKSPIDKEKEMSEVENKSVLIIAIVDKGYTDTVMDAARDAGASGGTVVKAKGTGAHLAKFFGVSMSEEKEMVYIISLKNKRDDIVYAIMEKAGTNTDAHGIVFALPVESVHGINGFND